MGTGVDRARMVADAKTRPFWLFPDATVNRLEGTFLNRCRRIWKDLFSPASALSNSNERKDKKGYAKNGSGEAVGNACSP